MTWLLTYFAGHILLTLGYFVTAGVVLGIVTASCGESTTVQYWWLRFQLRYRKLTPAQQYLFKERKRLKDLKKYSKLLDSVNDMLTSKKLLPSEECDFNTSRMIDMFWRCELSGSLHGNLIRLHDENDEVYGELSLSTMVGTYGFPIMYRGTETRPHMTGSPNCVSVDVQIETAKLWKYLEGRYPNNGTKHWFKENSPNVSID